jgi:hypothetical protein
MFLWLEHTVFIQDREFYLDYNTMHSSDFVICRGLGVLPTVRAEYSDVLISYIYFLQRCQLKVVLRERTQIAVFAQNICRF